MNQPIVTDRPVETDPLFDCSARAFAERFMRRAFDLHACGRPMAQTARLAFSFAARHLQEQDAAAIRSLQQDVRHVGVDRGRIH